MLQNAHIPREVPPLPAGDEAAAVARDVDEDVREPRCTFADELADSAFARMRTEECRQRLEALACDMDARGWPVHAVENTCAAKFGECFALTLRCTMLDALAERSAFARSEGCYEDSSKSRLLNAYTFKLPETNTPERCAQQCLRAGFPLSGRCA